MLGWFFLYVLYNLCSFSLLVNMIKNVSTDLVESIGH